MSGLGLLNTRAATLEHTDRVWPNPFECHKVNAVLFSKIALGLGD